MELAAGDNLLLGESLMRKVEALKAELKGESPSPLERLLTDRVAACWMQSSYYDALMTQTKQSTPAQVKQLQQQQDSAHWRYLASMKILATVRKRLTPAQSPVEIASKFTGKGTGLRLREAPVADGVPAAN